MLRFLLCGNLYREEYIDLPFKNSRSIDTVPGLGAIRRYSRRIGGLSCAPARGERGDAQFCPKGEKTPSLSGLCFAGLLRDSGCRVHLLCERRQVF
jgi:hypothetical protein